MDALIESTLRADELIASVLSVTGLDYSAHREQIAREVFYEGHWEGNADITVECEGMRALRCIQEDEYDQSMDEDEDRPSSDKMIHTNPAYVWFADDTQ